MREREREKEMAIAEYIDKRLVTIRDVQASTDG